VAQLVQLAAGANHCLRYGGDGRVVGYRGRVVGRPRL
jgi:hypothetical protein